MNFYFMFLLIATSALRPQSFGRQLRHTGTTPFTASTDILPLSAAVSEKVMVTKDGLNLHMLCTPSPVEQELEADKRIPITKVIYTRLFEKLWLKLNSNAKALPNRPSSTFHKKNLPPLLFIHGSYHSSWCYLEHFIPYFSKLGYTCYAISLRGTSATGMSYATKKQQEEALQQPLSVVTNIQRTNNVNSKNIQTVVIEEHVSDIQEVIDLIKAEYQDPQAAKPIIIGHSLGGLIMMKLLEIPSVRESVRGAVFMCSVPPSGNGPMIMRFITNQLFNSLKIVYGFVIKAVTFDSSIARELFFDETFDDADISRYMRNFKADSQVGLDLTRLAAVLPSKTSMQQDGRASWVDAGSSDRNPQMLVLGGSRDFIVDKAGVEETAKYCGVDPLFLDVYHDAMLGPQYVIVADAIRTWMEKIESLR